MPELPEIETIRRNFEQRLLDRIVTRVTVYEKRLRWPVQEDALIKWIVGERIIAISRRSKYLIFHFVNDAALIVHLGMSGRLGLYPSSHTLEKHTHVVFELDSATLLCYRDPRRFGLVEVTAPGELTNYHRFSHLGPEPLLDDFNEFYLRDKMSRSKKAVKLWIMDAQNVVGVGNIYANEALFKAGIHPQRPVYTLTRIEQQRLAKEIKATLVHAISLGGTTFRDFRNAHGEPGFFQQVLSVYQKEGEFCEQCGAVIQKIVQSGRSTFFCPECQV